jgi:hypothetical protein
MLIDDKIPPILAQPIEAANYWLNTSHEGPISSDAKVNAWATSFVRLVDAAFAEYALAHAKVREFWGSPRLDLRAMHRAISHFESCLADTQIAIRCYTQLRNSPDLPVSISAKVRAVRPVFAKDAAADQVRVLRNAVQHIYDNLNNIPTGTPFVLSVTGPVHPSTTEPGQEVKVLDRLCVGTIELLLSDLHTWLYEMAGQIAHLNTVYPKPR